jgi:hypothetical protein
MDFLTTLSSSLIPQARAILPTTPWTPQACVLLGAIGLQESGGRDIAQEAGGPGQGYWQEEAGIAAVLRNPTSAELARQCVAASGILRGASQIPEVFQVETAASVVGHGGYPSTSLPPIIVVMRQKFLNFQTLQLCLARLMLWDNPNPLPDLGDCNGAWNYYDATWRPGSPRPESWASNYGAALQHFTGGS